MPRDHPPDRFAEFVAARSPALLRAAWLLTGDEGKAEDLLQSALATVWPQWSRIAAGGNPEAYVRRVLMSTFLSGRRRRWRFEIPTADLPEGAAGSGASGGGADHADVAGRSATRDAVRRALSSLSPQQRAVVVLRYAEDLSVEDTAAALGCSPGTVKVQAGRALAALRGNPHLTLTPVAGEAE